jgi:hypothetical protein
MARSARKPERETDESAKQASTKPDKTITTPPAGAAADTSAALASATSSKPDIELAGFQSGQFESLRAVLEKRSEASASASAIAEEFAALWLPIHAVDLELLVPALREAGAPESQSHAARVRKDLLNIVLADLISNDHSQDTAGARLEALSDAFGAYQKAAEQEREGLGEKLRPSLENRPDSSRPRDRLSSSSERLRELRPSLANRPDSSRSPPPRPRDDPRSSSDVKRPWSSRSGVSLEYLGMSFSLRERRREAEMERLRGASRSISSPRTASRSENRPLRRSNRSFILRPRSPSFHAAVPMTMLTDRAVGMSPGASQVSATVMTTMTGRAAATSLAAL